MDKKSQNNFDCVDCVRLAQMTFFLLETNKKQTELNGKISIKTDNCWEFRLELIGM